MSLTSDGYGVVSGSTLSCAKIDIDSIEGLRKELDKLKEENIKLTEWLSYGKYSAR